MPSTFFSVWHYPIVERQAENRAYRIDASGGVISDECSEAAREAALRRISDSMANQMIASVPSFQELAERFNGAFARLRRPTFEPTPEPTPEPPPKYKQLRFFDDGFGGAPKDLLPIKPFVELVDILSNNEYFLLCNKPWFWYRENDIRPDIGMMPRRKLMELFGDDYLRVTLPRGVIGAGMLFCPGVSGSCRLD